MSTFTFTTITTGRIDIDAGTFKAAPDSSGVVLTWDKANRVSLGFLGITLNIDATKDTVVIDGTSHAPNFYTGATLYNALVSLFPKATSTGGGGGSVDLSNYYTKPQANTAFQPAGSYATPTDVSTAVANLVNTSPTSLDTLKELADALGDDANFATTVTNNLATKQSNLVPTAIKTSAYTAAANDFVKTDASSGNVPITLPAAPADKTRIAVKMIAVSGSNTTTIAAGGSAVFNKAGGSTSISLSLLNHGLVFQYESATSIWNVVSGDIPLSGLDLRFGTLTQQNTNTTAIATKLSASNFVNRETPTGATNGVNTVFTLAFTPVTGTERVLLNGIELEPGAGNDYTISGTTITMTTAPISTDKVRVTYIK